MAGRILKRGDFVVLPAKKFSSVKEETREGIAQYLSLLTEKQEEADQRRIALATEMSKNDLKMRRLKAETMAKLSCLGER